MKTLVIGGGFVGGRVGAWVAQREGGRQVWVTRRNLGRRNHGNRLVDEKSPRELSVDVTDPRTFTSLDSVGTLGGQDRILFSVGFRRGSRTTPYDVHCTGLLRTLAALDSIRVSGEFPHIVLLSTTGVYHQTDGQWVDENSPTKPDRDSSMAHLKGESILRANYPSQRFSILRLAGLYGPDRIPRMTSLAKGQSLSVNPDSYLNLVHVDDVVDAIVAAWEKQASGRFCVSDDCPILRHQYYTKLAEYIAAPPPRFESSHDPNGGSSVRSASNKRVWNRKLRQTLLPKLKHPSAIESLRDMI